MNNNYFWFVIGGLSTVALIEISNFIGRIIVRRLEQKRQKAEEEICIRVIDREMKKGIGNLKDKNITEISTSKLPTCHLCKEEFDRGSHWLIFGKDYRFCFRCGLEGEIERFVKTEYMKGEIENV